VVLYACLESVHQELVADCTGQYFNTFLLLSGYSVSLRNVLPSTAYVIGIPFQFLWGYLSDRFESRLAFLLGPLLWGLVPTGILAFNGPTAAKLFAFMVDETYFVTHVCE
jgi:ACS family pantothenate transporter-like MFS transporter